MRKFNFEMGEYYHIYSRGVDKRKIFLTRNDQNRFVCSLYAANSTEPIHLSDLLRWSSQVWDIPRPDTLIDIGAYCLMPNHFHLLLREKREGGVTDFMRKHLTSYSSYFNLRHRRSGRLFEGAFKAEHVGGDQYLRYLYAYIHLNPVKVNDPDGWAGKKINNPTGAEDFLRGYSYSSYQDYLGFERRQGKVLNPTAFPSYFEQPGSFEQFVAAWIALDSGKVK